LIVKQANFAFFVNHARSRSWNQTSTKQWG